MLAPFIFVSQVAIHCFLTADEDIDGEAFLELDESELKILGQKIGVIKKLRRLKESVSIICHFNKCMLLLVVHDLINVCFFCMLWLEYNILVMEKHRTVSSKVWCQYLNLILLQKLIVTCVWSTVC